MDAILILSLDAPLCDPSKSYIISVIESLEYKFTVSHQLDVVCVDDNEFSNRSFVRIREITVYPPD